MYVCFGIYVLNIFLVERFVFHMLHPSFILSSIASCFIIFMHLYGFLCTPLIIFDHFYVSWEKLSNFLYPLSIMTKKGRNCGEYCTYLLYMLMYVFFTYFYMCCFFFFLYTHVSLFVCNLLFLSHTKMSWWVLFKVFQKYRLSKSTCHKLSSCKVFQEFVLG